ncbi:hypothetical protein F5X99DRAFT_376615 [Biscogniauxia marginata]|nr:hypothetical protein F5X99DRAFT_376615 [Biscogniauxia marginata]
MDVYPRLINTGNGTTQESKIESDLVPLSSGGVGLIVEGVFLTLLTGVWTAMRLYCRRLKNVPIALEDWLHIAALAFFYGQVATCIVSVVAGGAGHHIDELQAWHVVRFSKAIFVVQVLYALSVGFVKISITVLLMRIFAFRKLRIAGFFLIAFSTLWMILTILVGLLLCRPIERNWNSDAGGTCGNQFVGFGVVAAVDIFNELCLIILPIPSLWKLQIGKRYKVALAAVFSSGIVTLVIAALRIPILLETNFFDLTFDTRSQEVALAEPAVAIIISCSPLLRPLLDKILRPFLGTNHEGTSEAKSDMARRVIGGSSVSGANIKSRGYARFDDSDELLELGYVNSPKRNQETEFSITGLPPSKATQIRQQNGGGNHGIVVMKETIVSSNDQP